MILTVCSQALFPSKPTTGIFEPPTKTQPNAGVALLASRKFYAAWVFLFRTDASVAQQEVLFQTFPGWTLLQGADGMPPLINRASTALPAYTPTCSSSDYSAVYTSSMKLEGHFFFEVSCLTMSCS